MGLCSRAGLPVLFLRILCLLVLPISSQLLGHCDTHRCSHTHEVCRRRQPPLPLPFSGTIKYPRARSAGEERRAMAERFPEHRREKKSLFVPTAGCDLQGAEEKIRCSAGLLLHPVWHCCATRQPHLSEHVQTVSLTGVSWEVPAPAALLRWQHPPVPHSTEGVPCAIQTYTTCILGSVER